MKNKTIKKAIIYVRTSGPGLNNEFIDTQNQLCTEYCERNNLEVIRVFSDKGISELDDCQELHNTHNYAFDTKNNISAIVVLSPDRFCRDEWVFRVAQRRFSNKGINLISVFSDMRFEFKDALSEFMTKNYLNVLSFKIKLGLQAKRIRNEKLNK